MRTGCIIAVATLSSCGLSSGGRLHDGGSGTGGGSGQSGACNHLANDGHGVLEPLEAPFSKITALAFDSDRNLYVLNATTTSSWITVFGPAPGHAYLRTLAKGVLKLGIDFARDTDGSWWVLDWDDANIKPNVVHLTAAGVQLDRFVVT